MESILHSITSYITALDWSYIMTLIFIGSLFNHIKIRQSIVNKLGLKLSTRYRIVLIGLLIGLPLHFIRGYAIENVENLFHSFVFALVFHKLILDNIMRHVTGKPLEETVLENTANRKLNPPDEQD